MNKQIEICRQYKVKPHFVGKNEIIGLLSNINREDLVVNGLRHPPEKGTCGWYLWAGKYSEESDFFKPYHLKHLHSLNKSLVKFLALPPGWRFSISSDLEDVWYDANLINLKGEDDA